MDMPTEEELALAIAEAMRTAVTSLREAHRESFYYITLFTTGEALSPALSAWSHEALARIQAERGDAVADMLKWSHADSPYFAFGEQAFGEVKRLFALRPDPHSLSTQEFTYECALRLRAMESAIASLEQEGLFGTGTARLALVVNAEVMPPDAGNTGRARRLNPPEALTAWLLEAAEQ